MPGNIDQYKATLGYGARQNLFRLSLIPPTVVSTNYPDLFKTAHTDGNGVSYSLLSVLVHGVVFPKPRTVQKGTIDYADEIMNYAMEHGDYDPTVAIRFRNRTDFNLRNMFEYWQFLIQKPYVGVSQEANFNGQRLTPSEYKTDDFVIDILDHTRSTIIRSCKCYGAFPLSLDSVALDVAGSGEIFETTLTMSVDYYDIKSSVETDTLKTLAPSAS